MKKNTASQVIGAEMVNATTGAAFTSTVTAYVTIDGGTQTLGSVGSGVCTHEGNGFHTYAPSQAETNGDHVAFTFIGTGAVPQTIQVYTNTPQTGDAYARLGAPAGASIAADIAAAAANITTLVGKFTGITLLAQWLGALAGKQTANATAQTEINATGAGSGTYDATTDSQEAIRDNGSGGLTQQQVADALKLAPTAGTPADGSVNADLDAIKSQTDKITTANINIITKASGGHVEIFQGDVHPSDESDGLTFNFASGESWPADPSAATWTLTFTENSDNIDGDDGTNSITFNSSNVTITGSGTGTTRKVVFEDFPYTTMSNLSTGPSVYDFTLVSGLGGASQQTVRSGTVTVINSP